MSKLNHSRMKTLLQFSFYPMLLILSGVGYFAFAPLFGETNRILLVGLISFLAIFVIFIAEKLFPYRASWNEPQSDVASDFVQTNLMLPAISRLAEIALGWSALHLLPGSSFEYLKLLWPQELPIVVQLVLALLICEFFFYWVHRLSHLTKTMWSFHRAHHSVPRVYWGNSGRFHPVDLFLNWFFYFLPLIFFGISQDVIAYFLLLNAITGLLEHANVDYRAGILNRVFNTAELHRWHHSVVISESAKNFGKVLSIWDQIFSSYFLPVGKDVGTAGVVDEHTHLVNYWEELKHPFRIQLKNRLGEVGSKKGVQFMTISLLVLGILFKVTSAFAGFAVGKSEIPNYIGTTCVVDAQDVYEPHERIQKGDYKGLCVNPSLRRSVIQLQPTNEEILTLANFSHQHQFWIAEIPIQKVKAIMLQVEYFPLFSKSPVKIAHTQFRAILEENAVVHLRPQSPTQANQKELDLKGFIFSVENIGPFGENFDAVKGLQDQYLMAYRFVSVEQKYEWMITEQNHKVTQHVLKLSPAKAQAVIREGLRRGNYYGLARPYHSLRNSCVTELFDIVDDVLGVRPRTQPFNPNMTAHNFKSRGLLDSSKAQSLFGDEKIAPNK